MRKILIVEDDRLIAELEQDYLAAGGYEADIAEDGAEGLEMFYQKEYDLVILDVMLPGIDGFSLCREMRAARNLPIILITARRDDEDKIQGLGLGADDYMVKPFSPAEMVARVNAHIQIHEMLKHKQAEENREIRVRDLLILPDMRRVYVRDREVHLVNKEFELLQFLAENTDRIYSKEEIFEKIWGMDAIGDTATVTVHVNRIREKIEKDSSDPEYIETVWGAGYRMKGQRE